MNMQSIVNNISSMLKNSMGIILGLIILFLIIYYIAVNIYVEIARIIAKNHPTQKNAWRVYKLLCKFVVVITNHPKVWGKYRDMFNSINHSDDVPSEIKDKLKARLIKKGLYINNVRIIDNYKGEYK